jgi:hypothetical protein
MLYKFKDREFFEVIVPSGTIWYKAGVKVLKYFHINVSSQAMLTTDIG